MAVARAMQNRCLALEGVNNFRDYGGYAVAGGGRVRQGVLWRSAQHGEASPADLDAIHALGIAAVIDLRGPSERAASPCRRHPRFAAQVFTYPEETAGLALHTDAADGTLSTADARAAMLRLYDGIAFRENLIPMLRCYLMVLGRGEGPNLIHCVAGKDRTGFAVAALQQALGVHRDDVLDDYLLTNTASRLEQRIAAGAFRHMPRYAALDDATLRALWGVEAAYLERAFAAITERHGSFDAYLATVLDIDAARREKLRALYVEP